MPDNPGRYVLILRFPGEGHDALFGELLLHGDAGEQGQPQVVDDAGFDGFEAAEFQGGGGIDAGGDEGVLEAVAGAAAQLVEEQRLAGQVLRHPLSSGTSTAQ